MEAPEYLDLDEIDFSDDISYSVTSLKTIPELHRKCDSQNEDRTVSGTNWSLGVSTLLGNGQKPTGIADVYSKFRPVKRVSPLKHQPESSENNESDDQKNQKAAVTENKQDDSNSNANWNSSGGLEERNENMKKNKSILNIVKEGQISLLPHHAVDNLDKIHDENGNNLLHVAASQGHAECLQHLTSLMGEDCLNERNSERLTPAGLAIKNGQLECVRWMVSETEAIAELSCSKDHPSLIHYAGCYGQEKILLWLLQFMQEQGISLDEVDQDGNSAVHVAAQQGYLGCIQTLVEYGANVTMQNHAGEKPSQSAERQGHTMCSRYLVVVETCMSLASQVVKLTKQLKEQTVEHVTIQNQLQQVLETQRSLPTSPSSPSSSISGKPQWKPSDTDDSTLPKNKLNTQDGIQIFSSVGTPHHNQPKIKDEDSDRILRQLLGKEISEDACMQEKLSLEFRDVRASKSMKKAPLEKKELKLARLKHLMQRSLSESDTDSNNSEDQKNTPVRRMDKPRPQPIVESAESTENLHLMIKRHTLASGRRFPFGMKASKSLDGHSPSPTSESSDPDNESQYQTGTLSQNQESGDACQSNPETSTSHKVATSPKSALKSPSSKRRTAQNLKLRVTFEEPVVQVEQTEVGLNGDRDKERSKVLQRPPSAETGEQQKRPFGTFRSIMETLSGNQNNNNNYQTSSLTKTSSPFTSLGRKATDSKGNSANSAKGKNKPAPYSGCVSFSTSMLIEDRLCNYAWHNTTKRKLQQSYSRSCFEEPELQEFFL
ncbi:synphilin-1 isoform X3 [Anolis sagrei]|uniref:synphilin-1 isoform X3 n=1 Tax=Anolis sagrei TaxID=38937 RepID=UPI00351FC3D9